MQKIIIFGLAKSGIAAINFLSRLDCQIQICDDKKVVIDKVPAMPNIIQCYDVDDLMWHGVDYLLLSPGVPLYFPTIHNIVKLANYHQVKIISDIELFYDIFPKQNYIGITGTNGKSTTTSLIYNIFSNSKKRVDFGGNIGKAVFDMEILPENSHYILELSSYQLDLKHQTKLKIAILYSNLIKVDL